MKKFVLEIAFVGILNFSRIIIEPNRIYDLFSDCSLSKKIYIDLFNSKVDLCISSTTETITTRIYKESFQ